MLDAALINRKITHGTHDQEVNPTCRCRVEPCQACHLSYRGASTAIATDSTYAVA